MRINYDISKSGKKNAQTWTKNHKTVEDQGVFFKNLVFNPRGTIAQLYKFLIRIHLIFQ